jgi:TRAP-type C4-dicarboxylate transport system permease small subunit
MIGMIAMASLLLLTIMDVIFRFFWRPIEGTYELVTFLGACVIGFSLPMASWVNAHVIVDSFVLMLPKKLRNLINITTRCTGIALFILIGWNLLIYGVNLYTVGEVSQTLRIPFYPVAYGLAICSFMVCVVLFCDIFRRQE